MGPSGVVERICYFGEFISSVSLSVRLPGHYLWHQVVKQLNEIIQVLGSGHGMSV